MDDVERVARATRRARYIRSGNTPEVADIMLMGTYFGSDELADTAAAMRETRLIDAEALRAAKGGGWLWTGDEVADWLQSRAGDTQ